MADFVSLRRLGGREGQAIVGSGTAADGGEHSDGNQKTAHG
jgi:hypothetical protein